MDEYRNGRADGLREALAVIEALLAAEEVKLDLPAAGSTKRARRTRWQAYRNAASRIRTTLKRRQVHEPKTGVIEKALERIGL